MCAIGGPFCRMRCTRTSRTLCGFCLSLGIESLLFEYQKNLHRVIVKSNIPIFIIWRPTFPHQGWPNCHLRREERNTDGNCAWSGKRRIADHLCRVHGDSRQHQTHPAVKVDAKRWTKDKDKDRVWELAQLVVRRIGESFLTLPFLFTYWSTNQPFTFSRWTAQVCVRMGLSYSLLCQRAKRILLQLSSNLGDVNFFKKSPLVLWVRTLWPSNIWF